MAQIPTLCLSNTICSWFQTPILVQSSIQMTEATDVRREAVFRTPEGGSSSKPIAFSLDLTPEIVVVRHFLHPQVSLRDKCFLMSQNAHSFPCPLKMRENPLQRLTLPWDPQWSHNCYHRSKCASFPQEPMSPPSRVFHIFAEAPHEPTPNQLLHGAVT